MHVFVTCFCAKAVCQGISTFLFLLSPKQRSFFDSISEIGTPRSYRDVMKMENLYQFNFTYFT